MWLEIENKDSQRANQPPVDITPQPVLDFECRLVIWHTQDIPCMDIEGVSDVFVQAYFNEKQTFTTDTHWRCQNGKASFNYRLKIPIKSEKPEYMLTIETYDKDIISSNELIGQAQFDIMPIVEDAILTNRMMSMNKKYFNDFMKPELLKSHKNQVVNDIEYEDDTKFWVPMRMAKRKSNGDVVFTAAGEVLCSLQIYPKAEADKQP